MKDPVSLHKYLYDNANPVSNSDPTGYSALVGGITAGGIMSDAEARHNTAVMKIFAKLMVKLNAIALFLTTYKMQIMLITLLVMFATGVAGSQMPNDIQREIEAQLAMLAAGLGFLAISLAKALENIKIPNKDTNDHHIVAENNIRALPAQIVLATPEVNIGLNDSRNLVTINTKLHWHLHRTAYFTWVNIQLTSAHAFSERGMHEAAVSLSLLQIKTILESYSRMIL